TARSTPTASSSGAPAASSSSRSRRSVSDTRLRRLADVLIGYSTQVRPGDLVLIEAPALAAPLVREVQSAVLHAGGHPRPRITIDGLVENLLVHGSDEQLEFVNPVRIDEIETADVRIVLE